MIQRLSLISRSFTCVIVRIEMFNFAVAVDLCNLVTPIRNYLSKETKLSNDCGRMNFHVEKATDDGRKQSKSIYFHKSTSVDDDGVSIN